MFLTVLHSCQATSVYAQISRFAANSRLVWTTPFLKKTSSAVVQLFVGIRSLVAFKLGQMTLVAVPWKWVDMKGELAYIKLKVLEVDALRPTWNNVWKS